MTWFKFLGAGATAPFSAFRWPVPVDGAGDGWVVVHGPLEPCRSGLHLCRPSDLPFWMLEELYTVEVDGPVLEFDDFVVARRARLLRRVDTWGQGLATSFNRDCVRRLRDLTAATLRGRGLDGSADRLQERDTARAVLEAAQALPDDDHGAVPLVGYLQDAAHYALSASSAPRWPADTATVAFICATTARVSAEPGEAEVALAVERARQAAWLTEHVLATA